MADFAPNSYLSSSNSSLNSNQQIQSPPNRLQSGFLNQQIQRLNLQNENQEVLTSANQISPRDAGSPYGALSGGATVGFSSNGLSSAQSNNAAAAVRAFTYYQTPSQIIKAQSQGMQGQTNSQQQDLALQLAQIEVGGGLQNQLVTLTAITDESSCEVPHKPSMLAKNEQANLISSLNQQAASNQKQASSSYNSSLLSPTQLRLQAASQLNGGSAAQVNCLSSGSGQIPMKGSESAIKSLSNIKVQITSGQQSKAAVANYHSSVAKYHALRLSDEDSQVVQQAYGSVQSNYHPKDFASLVVLSEESCKSDSKLKINSSRVADSTISQYQQASGANIISNQNVANSQKIHPKYSVISVGNKMSQLAQSQNQLSHSLSSSSLMMQPGNFNINNNHSQLNYQNLSLPQSSIGSSHSQTSLKHHISQQHQLYQQLQLLQQNSPHTSQQPHLSSSNSIATLPSGYNLLGSPQAQAALLLAREQQSQMNSMRGSKEMLKSASGVCEQNYQHQILQQSSSVPEKRSSINSYNKRVIELHLNQNSHSKNQNAMTQVINPNTLKSQMSLDISEIPQKQKTLDNLSANLQMNSNGSSGYQSQTYQNSALLSIEKIKPQTKALPISSNISPKQAFGSPRFSVNAINTIVPKSKLVIRKGQQNQLTQGTNSANKSIVNNLSRSEQHLNLNNHTLSNSDYSHYHSGSGTVQVNQSQSISNFKQNSSPQFNKFLHNHPKTSQGSSLKKHQQFLHQQQSTLLLQSAPNKSQNTSQTQLLRNLSSEGQLNNLYLKQLRVSESTKVVSFKNVLSLPQDHQSKLILSQNLQSAFDLKRDSQRYYSPNPQISINKALSRISSVGELKKAYQQMATARKSIQGKQSSQNTQINHNLSINSNQNSQSNLMPSNLNSGLSTMLTAQMVMQNTINKKHQQSVGGTGPGAMQNSRSKDRLLLEHIGVNLGLSKSASKAKLKNQTYSQEIFDDIANDVVNEDLDDDNEYMTNQEKLWNSIETNQEFKIIEELLKQQDVKVDVKNAFDDGWTALHYAVHEGNIPVIKLLIEKYNAGVEPRSATNKTPFHLACIRGDPVIIKYLLEKGVSPHVVDRDGCTPLHYLCETENHEMVKFLLRLSGPSRDVRNRFGKKPVDLIQDKEMKRLLRNYSQRRESQRVTQGSSQNSYRAVQELQPQSLSRERSTSHGPQNVIQITRLNDNQEVQEQIQQMFRKFSQFQQQHLQRKQGGLSKERPSNADTSKQSKKGESGNVIMFSNASSSGNVSHRNVLSPSNSIGDSKAIKKGTNNHPSHRLTLGPSNKNQIQVAAASSNSTKNIKKGTLNAKINLMSTNPSTTTALSQNSSQSSLLLKNVSPNKQFNAAGQVQTSKNATHQTLLTSQSQRKLNSKTPALSSVKSQARFDTVQNQSQLSNNLAQQSASGVKNLASIQSVTNLLQEKHKQILLDKEKGISQTPQVTQSNGIELNLVSNHINFVQSENNQENSNSEKKDLKSNSLKHERSQQEFSQEDTSQQYYAKSKQVSQKNQRGNQQASGNSNTSSAHNSGQKQRLNQTTKVLNSQQAKSHKASNQPSQGQGANEYLPSNRGVGQFSDQKSANHEDQGVNLSQRTGDSSHINLEIHSTTVVNKNHKLTTFSMNQLSDGNDNEDKAKQDQALKVGPQSFIAHQLLGTGSFGEVFLVEKISNGRFYAMKVLTKSKIMGHNLTRYAMTERNVMSIVHHPFIVRLNYAFQTAEKLFLILDYCPGGDLAEYLQLEKRFNEDKVRLYSSEILLALEELHRKDIIFRDLKPDNVVLDHEGHAMLTDFGLSKEGVLKEGMAKSFCGSYAYLAPEMLKKVGHGKAVDWYLLGVIIYEMLCGTPPYYANNKEELFENIKNAPLDIPSFVSPVAKDIIVRLLHRNPKKRLGTFGGADEIKKHPFFKNIDWGKLFNRAYRPPEPYLRKRFDNFLQMSPALQTNADVYESLRKQALLKSPANSEQHVPGWSFVSPVKDQE